MPEERESVDGMVIVPEKTEKMLNQRQLVDYREYRKKLLKWLAHLGKDPEKAEGYAPDTANQRAYRIDAFYRWVWTEITDGYTLSVTTDHADEYMKHLAHQDYAASYKATCQKSVKTLFKWRNWEFDEEIDWDPAISYSGDAGSHHARDFVTIDERRKLREAALEYKSIPHYQAVTPEERDRWKAYLAQRFGKPKKDIGMDDWERANSFKIPSLVWTSLDAGFRPVEVGRATVQWVDIDNNVLRIPKEDSSEEHRQLDRQSSGADGDDPRKMAGGTEAVRPVRRTGRALAHARGQPVRHEAAESPSQAVVQGGGHRHGEPEDYVVLDQTQRWDVHGARGGAGCGAGTAPAQEREDHNEVRSGTRRGSTGSLGTDGLTVARRNHGTVYSRSERKRNGNG